MIEKFSHEKNSQVDQKSRYESQIVAALTYYNYYQTIHEEEKITRTNIEEFDKKLKDDANVKESILYKSLMLQQEYNK